MENDHPSPSELEPREPTVEDLVELCRELNRLQARYVVVGGFAMQAAGYVRRTIDIDLIIATDPENEARVYQALAILPDQAARQLRIGEVEKFMVVRVADEIVVDLMKSAGGIVYAEAAKDIALTQVQDVPIPFASPRLLWRMKAVTHREKDAADLLFLRYWFENRGEQPPKVG
jgi:hypothetical protein